MAVTPAAQQLVDEVEAQGHKAELLDTLDGLGFQREVRLTPATVKALGEETLEALGQDARIEDLVHSSRGVKVVFVADPRADHAHPFGL